MVLWEQYFFNCLTTCEEILKQLSDSPLMDTSDNIIRVINKKYLSAESKLIQLLRLHLRLAHTGEKKKFIIDGFLSELM